VARFGEQRSPVSAVTCPNRWTRRIGARAARAGVYRTGLVERLGGGAFRDHHRGSRPAEECCTHRLPSTGLPSTATSSNFGGPTAIRARRPHPVRRATDRARPSATWETRRLCEVMRRLRVELWSARRTTAISVGGDNKSGGRLASTVSPWRPTPHRALGGRRPAGRTEARGADRSQTDDAEGGRDAAVGLSHMLGNQILAAHRSASPSYGLTSPFL